MKLDTLSKQCIIIGAFAIALCIDCIAVEFQALLFSFGIESENRSDYITISCLKLVAYVAVALTAILKIIGIKKRRASLLAPWLLAVFGGVTYFIYDVVVSLMSVSYSNLDFLLYPITVFGVSYILLYPSLTVLADIRRETANAVRHERFYTNLKHMLTHFSPQNN